MKLVKKANGEEIYKMSKKEWLNIGKKAGWMKEATSDAMLNNGEIQVGDSVEITNGPLTGFKGLVKSVASNSKTYAIQIVILGQIGLINVHKDYVKLLKKNHTEYQEGMKIIERTLDSERKMR